MKRTVIYAVVAIVGTACGIHASSKRIEQKIAREDIKLEQEITLGGVTTGDSQIFAFDRVYEIALSEPTRDIVKCCV
jgi:hypothetical protein